MWKLLAALTAVFVVACGFSRDVPPDAPGPAITIGFEKPTSVVDRKTGVHQIRVKVSEITTRDVSVHYQITGGSAVPPTDYDLVSPETITIPAGEQYAFFEVKINPVSDADRPDQTIDISLLNPSGASIGLDKHEITILAKALPRVSFELDTSSAQEPADAVMTVKLDEPSEFDVTVDYTVTPMGTYTIAGSDYTLANGTITFPAGSTMQQLTLDVLQDALDEDDESVQVVLDNPTKAFIDMTKDRHTHTITDDDLMPVVTFQANQTVGEGAGAITVGVTLTPVSGRPVTVPYAVAAGASATAGADFTVTNTQLTINPGSTTATIAVTIIQDTTDEPTESFQIDLGTLVNATGAPASHVVSITDDDLVCYGPAPFSVCLDTAPTGALAITTNINTSTGGSNLCAATQPTGWTTAPQSQDAACVIARDTITIAAGTTIAVTGNRPLVLVAATSITIDGTLDASSNNAAGSTGAASPGTCDAFLQNPVGSGSGGGGGAGATFVSIGGAGGTGDGGSNVQAGTPPPAMTTPLAKLRAGCNGQRGGGGGGGNQSGAVGRGGGAVYIVTGGTISLGAASVLNASGSGGAGGNNFTGGTGGGSGGMLKLHATTLTATTGAKILANGGGGASGADNNSNGNDGSDPDPVNPTAQAAGGPSGGAGAAGGAGYAGTPPGTAAVVGDNGGSGKGGGGGGGGGGYVQSNNALTNVTVSAGVIQIP